MTESNVAAEISEPGQTYTSNGRRVTYFRDPDGHLMEILTPPDPA